MCTVEDAANPDTATPAKLLFRTNDQNSRFEHHRIRSGAQHNADGLSLPELAVNTSNEGVPIGISGAVRHDVPNLGGRPIDKNVGAHATIFVQEKEHSNCADNNDSEAFQQQSP